MKRVSSHSTVKLYPRKIVSLIVCIKINDIRIEMNVHRRFMFNTKDALDFSRPKTVSLGLYPLFALYRLARLPIFVCPHRMKNSRRLNCRTQLADIKRFRTCQFQRIKSNNGSETKKSKFNHSIRKIFLLNI